MNLQLDYLRTFIALAETKGFTKAGIQVNRSQTAVSMQIKRLESEIGKKLFDRIGKTVKLTAEGNILISYALRIAKEHDDAVRALSKPDPGFVMQKHKTVSLALFEGDCIFRTWAIEALEKAGLKYRIAYVSRSISGLLDAVRAGFAIAPIIRSNVPPDLKIVGIENGLPVMPVSNIVLHKTKKVTSEIIDCFSEHIIKSFREKI